MFCRYSGNKIIEPSIAMKDTDIRISATVSGQHSSGPAGRKLVRLFTPWSDSPLYMSAQRFAEFTVADDADYASGVNLLAHEDVALKAYFETAADIWATWPRPRRSTRSVRSCPRSC
ncbi:hypothetical protein [Nonomuraea sp. NPDC003804]|uniref:hypothetical protein n=1 Tax=Nonomuraea sp. NPDC003804 TaxID=3154547 RepID=UPI0033BB5DB0